MLWLRFVDYTEHGICKLCTLSISVMLETYNSQLRILCLATVNSTILWSKQPTYHRVAFASSCALDISWHSFVRCLVSSFQSFQAKGSLQTLQTQHIRVSEPRLAGRPSLLFGHMQKDSNGTHSMHCQELFGQRCQTSMCCVFFSSSIPSFVQHVDPVRCRRHYLLPSNVVSTESG